VNQRLRTFIAPVAAFLLVLGVGAGTWLYLSGAMGQSAGASIGGPFTLMDGAGHTVTDRDLRGHFLLVYFGYTFCPDVCPTTLNEIAGAMDVLGERADAVQPVFITVDPQRDTPKIVADYVAAFSPRIMGLTGSEEQIATVAREYRVYYAARKSAAAGGDYTVDHSSVLYLMDRAGQFVAPIRANQPAAQLAAEIAKHLS
jgi:cytochrome oxidase Cu insertion factor (SCO1/SenC/PrrC family)